MVTDYLDHVGGLAHNSDYWFLARKVQSVFPHTIRIILLDRLVAKRNICSTRGKFGLFLPT